MAKKTNNDEPKERRSKAASSDPQVDDTNWRVKVQRRRSLKFDDVLKAKFLEKFLETGKKILSAEYADIALSTVDEHIRNDPEFAAQYDETLQTYKARIVDRLENEALEGHEEKQFDKETGELVRTRKILETPLRQMILKRMEPEYRDKQDINLTGQGGGVLVVPAHVPMEDFLKEAEAAREKMLKDQAARNAPQS